MLNLNRTVAILLVVIAVGFAFYWMMSAVRRDQTPVTIAVHRISPEGVGEKIGEIIAEASGDKIVLKPQVAGLEPGAHAFHVHENPSCEPGEKNGAKVAGLAAGGHFDPHGAMKEHGHDDHSGHDHSDLEKPAGDLPELVVEEDGVARKTINVATLTLEQLHGRAIMIHAHSEAPADDTLPKGGGARIACGVVPD